MIFFSVPERMHVKVSLTPDRQFGTNMDACIVGGGRIYKPKKVKVEVESIHEILCKHKKLFDSCDNNTFFVVK